MRVSSSTFVDRDRLMVCFGFGTGHLWYDVRTDVLVPGEPPSSVEIHNPSDMGDRSADSDADSSNDSDGDSDDPGSSSEPPQLPDAKRVRFF